MSLTNDDQAILPRAIACEDDLPEVYLLDVRFDAITEDWCVQHVINELNAGRGGWVVTANLDHLRRLSRDPEYAKLCSGATLVVADGMPLIWASRIQGTPLPERIAGSNLIWSLSKSAIEHGRSLFLLGGESNTASRAAEVLRSQFGAKGIAGTFYPPPGFENDSKQMDQLTESVKSAKPDIVYVALGSPKQERLIEMLRQELPGTWWMGVGISFSFLSGDVRRAPLWMQWIGLEWVHRLAQEPVRLAKRYLIHGIPFAAILLGKSACFRIRGSDRTSLNQSIRGSDK